MAPLAGVPPPALLSLLQGSRGVAPENRNRITWHLCSSPFCGLLTPRPPPGPWIRPPYHHWLPDLDIHPSTQGWATHLRKSSSYSPGAQTLCTCSSLCLEWSSAATHTAYSSSSGGPRPPPLPHSMVPRSPDILMVTYVSCPPLSLLLEHELHEDQVCFAPCCIPRTQNGAWHTAVANWTHSRHDYRPLQWHHKDVPSVSRGANWDSTHSFKQQKVLPVRSWEFYQRDK